MSALLWNLQNYVIWYRVHVGGKIWYHVHTRGQTYPSTTNSPYFTGSLDGAQYSSWLDENMRLLASLCNVSFTVMIVAQKYPGIPFKKHDSLSFQIVYPAAYVSVPTPVQYSKNKLVSNLFSVTWQNVTYLAVESALKQIQKQREEGPECTILVFFTLCRGERNWRSKLKTTVLTDYSIYWDKTLIIISVNYILWLVGCQKKQHYRRWRKLPTPSPHIVHGLHPVLCKQRVQSGNS